MNNNPRIPERPSPDDGLIRQLKALSLSSIGDGPDVLDMLESQTPSKENPCGVSAAPEPPPEPEPAPESPPEPEPEPEPAPESPPEPAPESPPEPESAPEPPPEPEPAPEPPPEPELEPEPAPEPEPAQESPPEPEPAAPPKKRGGLLRAWKSMDTLRRALLSLCLIVMLGSGTYLVIRLSGTLQQMALERRQKELYNSIASLPPPPSPPPSEPAVSLSPDGSPSEQTSDVPPSPPPPDYRARFADALAVNPDFVGVLRIPALEFQQFFVQGTDNDLYLHKNFEGKDSKHGTVFLDYRNSQDFSDHNHLLFGHNMVSDGTIFHPLLQYASLKTYLKAPVIELDTVTGPSVWLIFAAYTCESDSGYMAVNPAGEAWDELLDDFLARSAYHTGVEVEPSDTVLTLSTCDYDFEDARFVIHARRLRPDEDISAMEFTAAVNKHPKKSNVPNEQPLTSIEARDIVISQYSGLRRYYYYQRGEDGLDWYTGSDTKNAQGPYTAYTGKIDAAYFSWVAASNNRLNGKRSFYLVSGGLGGQTPGLYLLRTASPRGTYALTSKSPVTPKGVDARWPLLYTCADQNVLLYYTVLETVTNPETGVSASRTALYMMPVPGGTPERLCDFDPALDVRPVSALELDGRRVVLLQEFAGGAVRGFYWTEGKPQFFTVELPARKSRFSVFYSMISKKWLSMTQDDGMISISAFDITLIPPYTPEPSPAPSELPSEPPSEIPSELPSEIPSEPPSEIPSEPPSELRGCSHRFGMSDIELFFCSANENFAGIIVLW